MSEPAAGQHPTQLSHYRILAHIATGGMGTVYRAMDEKRRREVAIKVLNPEMASKHGVRERFRREAVLGRRLRHRNIVELYEYDEVGDVCFLVMEFVKGMSLDEYLRQHQRLEPAQATKILKHIAKALDHAYQFGIVHRDIKPANILLTNKNGTTIAKVADLGLSRETRDDDFRVTREGHTVGTVDYLSPEQARNSHFADIRSDIYSLGCTLFDMLTGAPPFNKGGLTERLYAHAETPPPDIRELNPKVPAKLALICKRMLEKKPENRYQTPAELLDDLKSSAAIPAKSESEAQLSATDQSDSGHHPVAAQGAPEIPRVNLPSARSPATPEEKQQAVDKFTVARRMVEAGDQANALPLLLACCQLDPTRVEYRRYLRKNFPAKADGDGSGMGFGWLKTVYQKGLYKAAKLAKSHMQILALGEQAILNDPKDLSIHVDMAEAAQALKFNKLALWLLKQLQKLEPASLTTNRALANFFEKMQLYRPAMRFWEMVDKNDPGNSEAASHLKDLAARETISRGHFRERIAERKDED